MTIYNNIKLCNIFVRKLLRNSTENRTDMYSNGCAINLGQKQWEYVRQ